jgi:hypothetical protein
MLTFDEIFKRISQQLGVKDIKDEQKRQVLELAQKRVGVWVIEQLNDEQIQELNAIYTKEGDKAQLKISEFLKSHIADFDSKVNKVLEDLVKEINLAVQQKS